MNALLLNRPPAPPGELHVILSLNEFLALDNCPSEWLGFNLYLFRDSEVAFYIEQWNPCFNIAANPMPTRLPSHYQAPDAHPQHLRRLGTMRSEARAFLRAELKRKTLDDIDHS